MYFFLGRVRTKFFCTVECTLNAPYNEVKTPVFLYKSCRNGSPFKRVRTKFFFSVECTWHVRWGTPGQGRSSALPGYAILSCTHLGTDSKARLQYDYSTMWFHTSKLIWSNKIAELNLPRTKRTTTTETVKPTYTARQ